ncbi:MAG: hypothetical protein JW784_00970 [Candidatus Cloacimonetes bacterium]|nr:hypothetical protein [Candidatus Cloacimonadota bacterium]
MDMIVEISSERAAEVIEKISRYIVRKRMAPAALMTIESLRPLHGIGSQILYFLAPFAEVIFKAKEYQEFAALLEKEEYIKLLLKRIDELDEETHREERQQMKIRKKRRWKRFKQWFKSRKSFPDKNS